MQGTASRRDAAGRLCQWAMSAGASKPVTKGRNSGDQNQPVICRVIFPRGKGVASRPAGGRGAHSGRLPYFPLFCFHEAVLDAVSETVSRRFCSGGVSRGAAALGAWWIIIWNSLISGQDACTTNDLRLMGRMPMLRDGGERRHFFVDFHRPVNCV